MKRRVVITGTGVVTPLACDVDKLWTALVEGQSGIHPLTVLDTEPFKVRFGGDIPDFDLGDLVDSKEGKRLDRFAQFALHAAAQAVRQAGIEFDKLDTRRAGVVVGSGVGGLSEIELQTERMVLKGPDRVSPFTVPKMMINAAGGNLSIHYGLRGPNYSVSTACASAANAIGNAVDAIRYGIADVMLTGGSEAAICRVGLASFQNMKALSSRGDCPEKASRPFDADRDGFVLSEGAGMLVLEELEHARRRGATILGEMLGFGSTCDAGHITQPDAQGAGAAAAMAEALRDAELNPEQVDYINAHGTSTPLGDKAETRAVKNVFGDAARQLAISSTKSALGHSLGASGGVELVIAARAIQEGVVPPTINLETADPECDLDYTPNTARQRSLQVAMSNSFGFGGHNASVIVGRLRD
ncbi:beta-ketoacyl-ACP synthase II [Candidatus Laterigemmans baculatus]|uniref:beta-ketoacyl-ACP synthase II n=1 Tax=Candidatus Laterigemmans baculatus TaxID=2770505 RepID=UPI0013DB2867|nr:beta-ketoacyl-ACP synthase II [Candidatus Laterigemmans baculatus]